MFLIFILCCIFAPYYLCDSR